MRRFLPIGLILGLVTGQVAQAQQAQSRPEFCQINSSNLGQYVSSYNIFTQSAPTIFRPFSINKYSHKLNKELIATPLLYFPLPDGSIAVGLELQGKYGNHLINKRDVVVQYLNFYPGTSSAEIAGTCVNGEFVVPQRKEIMDVYKLPLDTQLVLQEARSGVDSEQFGRAFK